MEIYEQLTLGALIDALDELGDDYVRGLGREIDSYRGYYERNTIEPDPDEVNRARVLAEIYRKQIGKYIQGYKGGDYRVSTDENVYCAPYGATGPAICGFIRTDDGVYEPLLVHVFPWG